MSPPKDPVKREEWRRKQSVSHSGERNWWFGKHHTKEEILKISQSHEGLTHTEETIQLMSENRTGEGNPMFGRHHTLSTRKRLSDFRRLEKHPTWKGGISFEPYCVKFNREFKERVRAFFGYRCVECEMTTEENGRAIDVHHVNYDKMMCCNDVKPLFVALCRKHNSAANHDRENWQEHYTEIIMNRYGGSCYIPKNTMHTTEDIPMNKEKLRSGM